ncbi:MAG: hypothetical protein CMI55_03520 [Parcubacteria group bacterium]|nr:hypothetical protein [Parcubacteria group bacterium]|tara:strand:+ start:3480 stop:4187 length:708 start_codon:yes stop_codon:yes gene_type:complete
MLHGKSILAVVPARDGSKGIPNKNLRKLMGTSLIGLAGLCLSELTWLDGKIISTDSKEFADEGKRYGLDVPFLRPESLSSDTSSIYNVVTHALLESDKFYGKKFDVVLLTEPTSPLRKSDDLEGAVNKLILSHADTVVTVSRLNSKCHPAKVLTIKDNKRLDFYEERGAEIINRQSLETLYWRNGVCYVVNRESLLKKNWFFTENTLPFIIEREFANIDEPIDLEWAEVLLRKQT